MKFIPMHHADVQSTPEKVLKLQDDFLPFKAQQAAEGQLDLSGIKYFAERYLFDGLRLGAVDMPHARAALQLLLQANHGAIQQQLSHPGGAKVNIRDMQVELPGEDNLSQASKAWFSAYYLGLIGRSANLLSLLRDPRQYYDWMITDDLYSPYYQGHYTFLSHLGDPEVALMEYERSARAVAKIPEQWRVLIDIFYPLWLPVLKRDQHGFDKELEAAIMRHQSYWANPTESEEDNMNDPDGHYNLELTGIMAYARDIGLQVNIGSGYTPKELVMGDIVADIDSRLDFYF